MQQKRFKYLICGVLAGLLLIAAAVAAYFRYASPTRVALVNYPEYVIAPMLDNRINPAIEVEVMDWHESSGEELRGFDCVIFFGMGLHFTEEQQRLIDSLTIPVYTTSSTRRETALAVMTAEQHERMRQYFGYGGKDNFRRMLDFVRYELDGKRIRAPRPEPPQKMEHYSYFHTDSESGFKTFDEYSEWYRAAGHLKNGAAKVVLLSGNGGGDFAALIRALEGKGLDVIPVRGMWPDGDEMDKIDPDVVIYQPHGRLGERATEYLKQHNVPLLCPIKVNQPYEEYLRDQQGMTGGMLSQSITMPELDGGTVPFVLSALYRNERGLLEFRAIPDRLERFARLVEKITALKRKPNAEKKIAMIYYGSISQEAATAGLGTSQSILNILRRLKSEGYNVGELPKNLEEFDRELKENNAIFGNHFNGKSSDEVTSIVKTVTITPQEYAQWVKKSMPDDLYADVVERYGEFPGRSFRNENGEMAIGCIRFGNVILMPQSLPGEGEDQNKLVHGVKMSPPHTYIATYLYLRHGFEADALIHIGTHGSLEFTPWKQVALSSYDWPDVLIGEIPHYYLYIINNIGEAQIAKRRSYATMVSHLTPPFMNSEAYGPIADILEKLHYFETADNPLLKAEYGKAIIEAVKAEKIDRDLKLTDRLEKGELVHEDMVKIQEYLHEISDARVARGIYIIGRNYTPEEAAETARLMSVDAIANAQFERDLEANKVTSAQRDDRSFFRREYLLPAHELARAILANPEKWREKSAAGAAHPSMAEPGADSEELRQIIESGRLPDGRAVPPAMAAALNSRRAGGATGPAVPEPTPEEMVLRSYDNLLESTGAELDALVDAFNGGYLSATSGGDPVLNPAVVPTGKNLYGIDPERTPTRESFAVGKKLAGELIKAQLEATGRYPRKVGFSLWGGEFIRTQGVNIAQIFYLLGVEPIWDSRNRVQDVRLIPMSELKRPRIDVVIQTSGQFRGAATSRMRLIDKAVRLAAMDEAEGEFENFVRLGSLEITRALIASGMMPQEAKALSDSRIFGGNNGSFGTGITGMAQRSGQWDEPAAVAETYLYNMSTIYTEGNWGRHIPGMFSAAVKNTDAVIQSRSSNSWGPLSLDHVYEFTGGLSLAARHINGTDPQAYFNDLRTPGRAVVQEAGEAAMSEARSTVLNPKFIREMMKEGAATTGSFAEVFRNTFGWEVMKPDLLEDYLWEEYKEVYIDDKLDLGIQGYFEKFNPTALQEMTGVMLEAVRKNYWKADPATVRQIAATHAELMKKFDLPPLPNEKLQEMIGENLTDPELKQAFMRQIEKALNVRREQAEKQQKIDEMLSGQKLREQVDDSTSAGDSRMAMKIIVVIILIGLGAVIAGNFRHRRRA